MLFSGDGALPVPSELPEEAEELPEPPFPDDVSPVAPVEPVDSPGAEDAPSELLGTEESPEGVLSEPPETEDPLPLEVLPDPALAPESEPVPLPEEAPELAPPEELLPDEEAELLPEPASTPPTEMTSGLLATVLPLYCSTA